MLRAPEGNAVEKKPRKDGREHVDRAGGSVELPDALELTLERAKLRCGSMGGGVDPPVDTEKEEADIVSDVTLPRAAAVPSVLVSKCSSGEGVRPLIFRFIIMNFRTLTTMNC